MRYTLYKRPFFSCKNTQCGSGTQGQNCCLMFTEHCFELNLSLDQITIRDLKCNLVFLKRCPLDYGQTSNSLICTIKTQYCFKDRQNQLLTHRAANCNSRSIVYVICPIRIAIYLTTSLYWFVQVDVYLLLVFSYCIFTFLLVSFFIFLYVA